MNLLEYICRLCATSKTALLEFSNNLKEIERKYFVHLPLAGLRVKTNGYSLPYLDENKNGDLLLTLLFKTIRHGLAHLYQPTIVPLKDGKQLYIVLKNASGRIDRRKNSNHLCYDIDGSGNLCILVYPEYLLCDFRQAAENSLLFDKGLQVKPFTLHEDSSKVDMQNLKKAFRNAGASTCLKRKAAVSHP